MTVFSKTVKNRPFYCIFWEMFYYYLKVWAFEIVRILSDVTDFLKLKLTLAIRIILLCFFLKFTIDLILEERALLFYFAYLFLRQIALCSSDWHWCHCMAHSGLRLPLILPPLPPRCWNYRCASPYLAERTFLKHKWGCSRHEGTWEKSLQPVAEATEKEVACTH